MKMLADELEGRNVLYNPATDLYLRVKAVTQSTGYETYNILWDSLDESTTMRGTYVDRVMKTYSYMTDVDIPPPNSVLELVDMQVARNFMQLLDWGVNRTVGEIVLVPVECEDIKCILTIVGINFVLAESIL